MSNGRSRTVGQFTKKLTTLMDMAQVIHDRAGKDSTLALLATKFIEYAEFVVKEFNELMEEARKK
jgi:hypothetical protein